MLHAKGSLHLAPNPHVWFADLVAGPGVRLADMAPDILIDSNFLPGSVHGDPFDRIIIATARRHGIPVVTRDRRIIDYAGEGRLAVIAA